MSDVSFERERHISRFFAILRARLATVKASFEPFLLYWELYGRLPSLLWSPYLWVAGFLTWLCAPLWREVDVVSNSRPAIDMMLAAVPALMAFTLAGMAIVLALSGRRFIDVMREDGDPKSLFMKVVALFFHFLLVQTLALILSLVSRTYVNITPLAGVAFFLGCYGVTSAISIAAMLLNVSRIYNFTGGSDDKP